MAIFSKEYNEPLYSAREYLDMEHEAETKSEYYDGRIVAMSGASWGHNIINNNISRSLGNQLEKKPCVATSSDLRVRVEKRNRYFYPDTVVICGKPTFEPNSFDSLLNPLVIVEILSKSTSKRDRGDKWKAYQTLESLQAYLLVSQDTPRISLFLRKEDGSWQNAVAIGLGSVLEIEPIGCTLCLEDVYRNVEFASDAETNELSTTVGENP